MKKEYLESKIGYVLMADAISDHAIRNGRTADTGEYLLEVKLLNLIILDCSSREWRKQNDIKEKDLIRDSMCIKKLKSYAALEKLNATLIDLDFPLEVRREKLKAHFKRKLHLLDD